MPAQTIDSQILRSLPLLEHDQKKSLLSVIRSFLKNKEVTPTRLTIEEYNKELEEAEARVNAGFFTSHEDVLKESESW
jgi:hypothetical protein